MSKSSAKTTSASKSAAAAKAPAPAKKTVKAAAPVVKKAAAPVVKVPVTKAPAVKAPAVKKVAAVKTKAVPATTTTIVAAIDVGFGNTLSLRGDGPGLSWDKGVTMDCGASDLWTITLPESTQPIVCKFLINDVTWCVGDDYTVLPGSSVVLSPTF